LPSRYAVPVTATGKRRHTCGFLLTILPTLGMPDPVFRQAAGDVALRCTIRQGVVNPGMMRGLLEYVSQQMMINKNWTFQLSALEILSMIVRMKLPTLSGCILNQYLDMALDVSFNSPTAIVKLGALSLLRIMLLVFPVGASPKLAEIRDVVRTSITDKDSDVSSLATTFYPLIFKFVNEANAVEFCRYLQNEISVLFQRADHPLVASDPLVNQLTLDEETRILKTSILSLGSLNDRQLAVNIVWDLLVSRYIIFNLLLAYT
jgi:hypothetical protein